MAENQRKVFTDESLAAFVDEIKTYTESAVSTKADSGHSHAISEITNLQTTLNGKADSSHGTHVSYSSAAPVMDGTASAGSASTVARSDHKHPTDTSRASKTEFDNHVADTSTHMTSTEKTKLSGIESGAQKNTITGVKGNSESSYRTGNVNITKANIGLGNVDNTSDANKPVSTAQQTAIDTSLTSAKSYADTKIANLINGAPTTLDTLKEIADAMAENETVVDALESAIGTKVDKVSGKGLSTNDYTTTEKTKLAGIASGAQVNQNAFSNIAVSGQTTVAADTTTDTVTFAGSNVSITTDATNDKVTFSVADGSTSAKGVVQLTNSTSSTSTTTAATPNSVKSAYDLANTAKTTADSKQAAITGAATTITGSNLTASRALVSNASGKVAVSSVTSTQLGYLSGVTSAIQTQLNGKLSTSGTAAKATADASGNTITSTYATKTELNNKHKEITQAAYNALSTTEKNNGTVYMITDAVDEFNAGQVAYNNSSSGLSAVDVQGAIDEVNAKKCKIIMVEKTVRFNNSNIVTVSDNLSGMGTPMMTVVQTVAQNNIGLFASLIDGNLSNYTNSIIANQTLNGSVTIRIGYII